IWTARMRPRLSVSSSAARAFLNARIRKSSSASCAAARSNRSRNAATSRILVRCSMKYSSISCCCVSGHAPLGLATMWCSFPSGLLGVQPESQHVDTPPDGVEVDAVHFLAAPDGQREHDRQPSTEMLAELGQPAQHALGVLGIVQVLAQFGCV